MVLRAEIRLGNHLAIDRTHWLVLEYGHEIALSSDFAGPPRARGNLDLFALSSAHKCDRHFLFLSLLFLFPLEYRGEPRMPQHFLSLHAILRLFGKQTCDE